MKIQLFTVKSKFQTYSTLVFAVIVLVYIINACTVATKTVVAPEPKNTTDVVKNVINSFSSDLPKMSLPAGTDPEGDDWKGIDLSPKSPVSPLYVDEEAKRFLLPPGYHITPVLTDPQIQQPGAISFVSISLNRWNIDVSIINL